MKLLEITIDNLFSYHGKQHVAISPVTCIVGSNGFGKTSILNSVKLALGYYDTDVESILNNNADSHYCSVELTFDIFTVKRSWNFEESFVEDVQVFLEGDDRQDLVGEEAEEFIVNKIPRFLVDFLFYDGEVGSNLFLLSQAKMKNLFDYVFDLDLLGHVHRDALQVARKLLGGSDSPELEHYIELEHQKLKIEKEIKAHEDALSISKKKLKTLQLEVQKLETKIRNHSKKVKELHKDKDVKIARLTQRLQIFKTLIMYELPLLLNPSLIKGLQERAHSPVKLNDEKMFASHFQRFLEAIDSQANPDEAIKIFKKLLLTESSPIELSMERKNFSALLEELKNLQFEIKQLDEAIYDAESNDVKVNVVKALRRELLGKKKQEEADNATMSTLLHQIDISQAQLKDVNREMTKIYNQNQEKFALIKGYEELQEISTVANIVYHEELAEKLDAFNRTLTKNTASFLKQYKHIRKIYLDEKYRIVITDGQQKLKTDLLSAGQKQVLNFLIVKSILEYKDLASFVMVDTPFGRLSNANKKLLLEECYLQFDHLVLLLTDSEFEFVQAQNLRYTTYNIVRNDSGSQIEVAS